MKRRNAGFGKKIITTVLAMLVCMTMCMPVFAAGEMHKIIFRLENSEGGVTDTVTFNIEDGQTYGADADDAVSVRDTFYYKGKDYDLVSEGATEGKAESDVTFTYMEHKDKSFKYELRCVDRDGNLLKKTETEIPAGGSAEVSVPSEITAAGDVKYTTTEKDFTVKYSNSTSGRTIVYKPASDSESGQYTVEVRYVDAAGKVLQTRSFTVNKRDVYFYAPTTFALTESGSTVYYTAADGENTMIHHVPSDRSTTSYTIKYNSVSSDGSSDGSSGTAEETAYKWYIMQYDARTNESIGVVKKEVDPGSTVTFDPEKEDTIDGYTVNKAFRKTFSHTYGDKTHVTYVYYDPDGWKNSSDVQTRDITIKYVNIKDGSVLKTMTKTATSEHDTRIDFADSFDKDGAHYLRVDGQAAYVDHNFYSPKEVYTVYYRNEKDTEFKHVVITKTEVVETKVYRDDTQYEIEPGYTRVIATNQDNGQSQVIGNEDARGDQINGSGNDKDGADVSVDGLKTKDIETPKGNIDLSRKNGSSDNKRTAAIAGAAAALLLVLLILFMRKRRNSSKEENAAEK
ncbi:MAG: hypothetical protein ACI4LM_06105 [Anaerovoracaceae bacterium]